jgi:acetyl-CoA carboxylase biotin carboxyl carrier protein
MTQNELKELIELVAAKGFAEFEVEREGFKLKIISSHPPVVMRPDVVSVSSLVPSAGQPTTFVETQQAPPSTGPLPQASDSAPPQAPPDDQVKVMKSPIVGTFYRSPSPTSEAFVKLGDRVEVGAVLCIVEAMKLMNEIESEFAGEIVKVFVENSQPVEYGQPLFGIRP